MAAKKQIIAIVGPTASGKSTLAIELAKKIQGEIVCADSRTIYKGLNIGTAKPTEFDRKTIRHHCLDLVEPNEKFSVAQFQSEANKSIHEIFNRGKIPIIVGGSGMYIDSVIYGYHFDSSGKAQYSRMSLAELQIIAKSAGYKTSNSTWNNQRHLASLISKGGYIEKHNILPVGTKIFGLDISDLILERKIEDRINEMMSSGWESETISLLTEFNESDPGLQTIGYPAIVRRVRGEITKIQAIKLIVAEHKKLVKKQKTWFKRNPDIVWVNNLKGIEQILK